MKLAKIFAERRRAVKLELDRLRAIRERRREIVQLMGTQIDALQAELDAIEAEVLALTPALRAEVEAL